MENIVLSLTGNNSHTFSLPKGQGSLSIGTKGQVEEKYFDILVNDNEVINWNTFDQYTTPAGSPWPRTLYYYGNDTGFAKWAEKRPIEYFMWQPLCETNIEINLKNSIIDEFSITLKTSKVKIKIGDGIRRLQIFQNIDNLSLECANKIPSLFFFPPASKDTYRLPHFKGLEGASNISVCREISDGTFDCESLLQFSNMKELGLSGRMTNLESLAELDELEGIEIHFCPDLKGFPSLSTWKNLKSFFGVNIEKNEGKRLRAELKANKSIMESDRLSLETSKKTGVYYGTSSVSNLRDSSWFITEYNNPFSSWSKKMGVSASKKYKLAMKNISKAKAEEDIKNIIEEFVESFNNSDNIETIEREDIFTAVMHFIEVSPVKVEQAQALQWFDNIRDF